MPIYEYICNTCGHIFEAMHGHSEKPKLKCPNCSKSKIKKLVSAPQFQLKGSGWYKTDYKPQKSSDKKTDSSETSKTSDTESSTSKSSDTKSSED